MTTAGRPTVLDPTKKEIIYALLQVGASQRRAAAVVGVSEAVIRYALKYDPDFAQRVEQALALLEVELLVKLREGAGRSWRAAAYALEHLVPDRFSKNPPRPLFDPEFTIQRELEEMEESAHEQQEQAAAEGKPAPPPPDPDPNDPTTKAATQFAEQLNKLLAECKQGSPTRERGSISDEPNHTNPTRKRGTPLTESPTRKRGRIGDQPNHTNPTRKRGSHSNWSLPTTDHEPLTTDQQQPPRWQKTHRNGKPKSPSQA